MSGKRWRDLDFHSLLPLPSSLSSSHSSSLCPLPYRESLFRPSFAYFASSHPLSSRHQFTTASSSFLLSSPIPPSSPMPQLFFLLPLLLFSPPSFPLSTFILPLHLPLRSSLAVSSLPNHPPFHLPIDLHA